MVIKVSNSVGFGSDDTYESGCDEARATVIESQMRLTVLDSHVL